jgi:hypothetical protein
LPCPDPAPRPILLRFLVEPSAGLKLFKSIVIHPMVLFFNLD